jgi:hypothetical protein
MEKYRSQMLEVSVTGLKHTISGANVSTIIATTASVRNDSTASDHGDQHHNRHEQRTLGRHFSAGQQKKEGGGKERRQPTIS